MKINPKQYLEVAQEHIDTARILYNNERYSTAIYLAGVSIECLLLAYRTKNISHFDSKHDLNKLMKESGIANFVQERNRKKMGILLGEVWSRWKNNYRFASNSRLRSEFKKIGLDRGIKGDILKSNSMSIIDYAYELINIGVRRWNYN
jgi:uncharacterized protein (UPF0332 family)